MTSSGLAASTGSNLSYTVVKQALQGTGVAAGDASVGRIVNGVSGGRCLGCYLHIDCSATSGFQDER